ALPSRNQHVIETLDNLKFSPIASKAERIRQMLSEIHEAEMLESRIRHMPKSEHAILLWEEKGFLDIVLSEFFDSGVTGTAAKGLLEVEQDIGLRVKENMTILCGYDVSNVIDPKQLDKIMGFHGYAIVDHPFRVYRRAGD